MTGPEKIIVGLGNPGAKYEGTRHNVGFEVLDTLIDASSWIKSGGAQALFAKGFIGGKEVEFLKPMTFMNRSGESLKYVKEKHGLDAEDFLVIHDDLDLPVGEFKVSFDRGAAGHKGIKSIINSLESTCFGRVRIGISPVDEDGSPRKPSPEEKEEFVLKRFSGGERKKIDGISEDVINAMAVYIGLGREEAMNEFN